MARGDEQAFAALYDLVAPRVYGLIRRVLRDPAQAEEVADLLGTGLPTVKTRMRDGLIRLRDCLGVGAR